MELLTQFLLRLAFGLAVGMGITSSRKVFSGFYRNHLYVTLGLTTLAGLALTRVFSFPAVLAFAAAVCSFIGAACWLYDAKRAGLAFIWAVASLSLVAAFIALMCQGQDLSIKHGVGAWADTAFGKLMFPGWLRTIALVTSGLTLGVTTAAMLLGHWYLNAPGMELGPLRRLLTVAALAVVAQMLIVGDGLVLQQMYQSDTTVGWWMFVLLRWSFGLLGVLGLLWMAWQTLKIPNTQSATGILYVAVIGVFVGELTGLLLSAESAFPL
jgi:hypothetical protein